MKYRILAILFFFINLAAFCQQTEHSSAWWVANNPVLDKGQIGYETDTKMRKNGNGITAWNSLAYIVQSEDYSTASGTDTYAADYKLPSIGGLQVGQSFKIKFTNGNTASSTLNINSLGAITIKKFVSLDLGMGDIIAGGIYELYYDGTNFQITTLKVFPMAEIAYFNTTGSNITITAISDGSTNMVKCNPATTLENSSSFDNGGADDGRLRYTGIPTKHFHTAVTISFAATGTNDIFVIGIAKNGTADEDCKVLQKISVAGDTQSTALHCMIELETNDYIELYVGNMSSTDDFTIKTLNIFAAGF